VSTSQEIVEFKVPDVALAYNNNKQYKLISFNSLNKKSAGKTMYMLNPDLQFLIQTIQT